MTSSVRVIVTAVAGAVAGFLTRPCCVVPAALALLGVGSAGLAQVALTYRPLLMTGSVVVVGASLWLTFRREGEWQPKAVTATAAIVSFALSMASLRLL